MSAVNPGLPAVPEYLADDKDHRRKIAQALNQVMRGKINATLDVTLSANSATTIIKDARLGYYSAIAPVMALSASAATALAAGIWFDPTSFKPRSADTLQPPQITAHHNNTADADKTVRFLIIG